MTRIAEVLVHSHHAHEHGDGEPGEEIAPSRNSHPTHKAVALLLAFNAFGHALHNPAEHLNTHDHTKPGVHASSLNYAFLTHPSFSWLPLVGKGKIADHAKFSKNKHQDPLGGNKPFPLDSAKPVLLDDGKDPSQSHKGDGKGDSGKGDNPDEKGARGRSREARHRMKSMKGNSLTFMAVALALCTAKRKALSAARPALHTASRLCYQLGV